MKIPYRQQYKFWLNLLSDEEFEVAEKIEHLKKDRQFAKAIRDGITLVWDLRQGKVDALRNLYPEVYFRITQDKN